MIDFFFVIMAAGINSADGAGTEGAVAAEVAPIAIIEPQAPALPTVDLGAGVIVGQGVVSEGVIVAPTAPVTIAPVTPQVSGMNMAVVPVGLVADPQTPSGKFTTATEVKPILNATKGNWVAVREYNGQDLLYVTHLWSWRCGLHAMAISVNDEPMQNWPLPECHMKYSTPSAILEGDGQPYLAFKLGSVQTIDIQVVYDDLSMDAARFERGNVLIP